MKAETEGSKRGGENLEMKRECEAIERRRERGGWQQKKPLKVDRQTKDRDQ